MAEPDQLQRQLAELQRSVQTLTQRVARLEGQGPVVAGPPTSAPASRSVGPHTRNVTINPGARWAVGIGGFLSFYLAAISPIFILVAIIALIVTIVWPWKKRVTVTPRPVGGVAAGAGAPVVPPVARKPRQPSQFEQDLAKHWFSWLGVISLVVGITFLLGYTLRDYGVVGRVMTGYAAAAMLFGLAAWFWRQYHGFAFVLESGGWAVVYISTYALHVAGDHPIKSAAIGGLLLLGVVAAITGTALWQRSKTLAAGAFFLGYVTAFTNTVDLFTLTAMLLLAGGIVSVATWKRWPEFVLGGTIATYLVQFAWMMQTGRQLTDIAPTAATFLIAEVLIFGAAHWLIAPKNNIDRQATQAGTIFNLSGFYWLFHYLVTVTSNPNGWLGTLFIGVVCGLLALATSVTESRRYLQTIYTVFALALFTLSLGQRLQGDALVTAWLVESAALVGIGSWSGPRSVRWVGYVVTLMALTGLGRIFLDQSTFYGSTTLHTSTVLGLLGAVLYLVVGMVARSRRSTLLSMERFLPEIMIDIGIMLGVVVAGQELAHAWVPAVWSLGAVVVLTLGLQQRSLNLRLVGYLLSLLAMVYWIAVVMSLTSLAGPFNVHARLLSGLWLSAMLGSAGWFIMQLRANLSRDEHWFASGFAWAAITMLTFVLGAEIPIRTLSIAWGIEGVLLFALGFARQSSLARRMGVAVLGLTIAKVYLYDVETLKNTIYRILSFIILGAILLLIGYLYNRWRQRPKPSTPAQP